MKPFTLSYAWETPQEAAKRLGLRDLEGLCAWMLAQCRNGLADYGDMVFGACILPVFRKRLQQPEFTFTTTVTAEANDGR